LYLDLCRRPLKQDRHTAKLKKKGWGELFNKQNVKDKVSNEVSKEKTENYKKLRKGHSTLNCTHK